jgi:hypothetical protein
MDYAKTKEIIHQTSILSSDDAAFLDANITKIQDNWAKNQRFRTETEMRMSVLNDVRFPTHGSKYWQAVREQSVFYEQLIANSFAFRRLELKLLRLEQSLVDSTDDLDRMEIQIDIEEANFCKINLEAEARDRMRELRLWDKIMDELLASDQEFNSDNVDDHQLDSYRKRFAAQVGQITESTPMGEKNNLLGQIKTADRLLKERGMLEDNRQPGEIKLAVHWEQ